MDEARLDGNPDGRYEEKEGGSKGERKAVGFYGMCKHIFGMTWEKKGHYFSSFGGCCSTRTIGKFSSDTQHNHNYNQRAIREHGPFLGHLTMAGERGKEDWKKASVSPYPCSFSAHNLTWVH